MVVKGSGGHSGSCADVPDVELVEAALLGQAHRGVQDGLAGGLRAVLPTGLVIPMGASLTES